MRAVLILLLIAASGLFAGSLAAAPRWCALSYEGASNCTYDSIDTCRSATIGTGGFCMPEAPVDHRQPRASDVKPLPEDQLGREIERQNRKLDRELQICKGCR